MPEGPSILILCESLKQFQGQKVIAAEGNAKIDMARLNGKTIQELKTWGKHFLICFDDITIKIHLLMFGSYTINETKETVPRLSLKFKNGSFHFYNCSVKLISEPIDEVYDWEADVLSEKWSPEKAKIKLKKLGNMEACDALLQQEIFAGVGNIIKNEVLYRIRVHPGSTISSLPERQLNALIKQARLYSFDFLEWKKKYELRKHFLVYNRKLCLRCDLPITRKIMGMTKRRTFFCANCQILYD